MSLFQKKINQRALENFIESILNKASKWDSMSDFEKEHAMHWFTNYFKEIFE